MKNNDNAPMDRQITAPKSNVDSFSCEPEVENGMQTGRYVVLAKLNKARQLKRLYGRKHVYGDRVIVAASYSKKDALDTTVTFNNCLLFYRAIEHINSVLNKAEYVNDADYSFYHGSVGKTGVIVD